MVLPKKKKINISLRQYIIISVGNSIYISLISIDLSQGYMLNYKEGALRVFRSPFLGFNALKLV